jgi:hypothetical protein
MGPTRKLSEYVWAAEDTASTAATTGETVRENGLESSGVFGGGYSAAHTLTLRGGENCQPR